MSEENNTTVVENQEVVQSEAVQAHPVEKTEQEPSKNPDYAKIRIENKKLKKQ